MSFAFDTMGRAWETLRMKLPEAERDGEVAVRFGFLLEEMHEANHRINDAINNDGRVTSKATRLHQALARATWSKT